MLIGGFASNDSICMMNNTGLVFFRGANKLKVKSSLILERCIYNHSLQTNVEMKTFKIRNEKLVIAGMYVLICD